MEILNDMIWIPGLFFASNLIGCAIFGDERTVLKMFPADQAALEHSKAYYRLPFSLLEHLVMWVPFLLGLAMWDLWRERFGDADSVFNPIGIGLCIIFGGLGVFLSLKTKTRAIRVFMRRHNADNSESEQAVESVSPD